MKNPETNTKNELAIVPKKVNQNLIDNHKKAAVHFEAAAKSHVDAANHHESGNHEKAANSTIEAHGHTIAAKDAQREVVKQHTTKN